MVPDLEDDQIDMLLATARTLTDSGNRISLDEMIAEFGYARADLIDADDSPPTIE